MKSILSLTFVVVTFASSFSLTTAFAAPTKECFTAFKPTYNHDPAGAIPYAYTSAGTLCIMINDQKNLDASGGRRVGSYKITLVNHQGQLIYSFSAKGREFEDNGTASRSIFSKSVNDMIEGKNPGGEAVIVLYPNATQTLVSLPHMLDAGWTGGVMANYELGKRVK